MMSEIKSWNTISASNIQDREPGLIERIIRDHVSDDYRMIRVDDEHEYARIVESWIDGIGLDTTAYGTHSIRRTKASLIYRQTKNLRAVQLLLGHARLESTIRYLGFEVDDALELAEQTEV